MSNRLNRNFVHFNGDALDIVFSFAEGFDISTIIGASGDVEWVLRVDNETEEDLIFKNIGSGVSISENKVTVSLFEADTLNLQISKYYHQLRFKYSNETYTTCATGEMDLRKAYRQ